LVKKSNVALDARRHADERFGMYLAGDGVSEFRLARQSTE